ncbi:putative SAM-dependent methyltransferase [Rosellinia necatrix]|uniref:Putative SAM-dependent methyltransferase n=1 Tax=Rosellinia necatrix TaxID=77044 RepID=A0A1S8ABC3_ROSNE|nr:putative SAM-dependent methyltransferase [Rosellinia necatrix]
MTVVCARKTVHTGDPQPRWPGMSQNIYDQHEFFQNYIQLDRQMKGLDGAPEWPQLCAMLPDLKGDSLLDLGCGFG